MTVIEGMPFIPLGEKDYKLDAYLGIQLQGGDFKVLREKRNEAVDALFLEWLREIDEFATALSSNARKTLSHVFLPTTIAIDLDGTTKIKS